MTRETHMHTRTQLQSLAPETAATTTAAGSHEASGCMSQSSQLEEGGRGRLHPEDAGDRRHLHARPSNLLPCPAAAAPLCISPTWTTAAPTPAETTATPAAVRSCSTRGRCCCCNSHPCPHSPYPRCPSHRGGRTERPGPAALPASCRQAVARPRHAAGQPQQPRPLPPPLLPTALLLLQLPRSVRTCCV